MSNIYTRINSIKNCPFQCSVKPNVCVLSLANKTQNTKESNRHLAVSFNQVSVIEGCSGQHTSRNMLASSVWGRMASELPVGFVYPTCCNVMRTAAWLVVTSCNVNIDVNGKRNII